MKVCCYCERKMKTQNFKKHLERCIIRKLLNRPIDEIRKILDECKESQADSNEELRKVNNTLVAQNDKLLEFIRAITQKASIIISSSSKTDDHYQKIQEMHLHPDTIKEYQSDWRYYTRWCDENNAGYFEVSSAKSYLGQLKTEVSTIKKKRSRLQSILNHLSPGFSVHLPRINRRIRRIPKYALSNNEIKAYLEEQKNINNEDYIIQMLLIVYAGRINMCSGLKLKHLEFLKGGNTIYLPDRKTGVREAEITSALRTLLKKHVDERGLKNSEDFIFHAGQSPDLRNRAAVLSLRINKRLKKTKLIPKSDNYKVSSHMFRKTKAFQEYTKYVEMGKEAARKVIGQQSGSTSINFYID